MQSPPDWLSTGREHASAGRFVDALVAFQRALHSARDAATARVESGRAWAALGRPAQAHELWDAQARAAPSGSGPWLAMAEENIARGDPERAVAAAERAVALLPSDARGRRLLAIARALTGHDEGAAWRHVARDAAVWVDQPLVAAGVARAIDLHRATLRSGGHGTLARYCGRFPTALLAALADAFPDPTVLQFVARAVEGRKPTLADHDACRRVAWALRDAEPAIAHRLAADYAEVCRAEFVAPFPLVWPLRSAGTPMRLAVLVNSATESTWQAASAAIAARASGRAIDARTIALPSDADCARNPSFLSSRGMLTAAQRIAAFDPDVLLDLVALAGSAAPLMSLRPARAVWTIDGGNAPSLEGLADRTLTGSTASAPAAIADAALEQADRLATMPSCPRSHDELVAMWTQAVQARAGGDPVRAARSCEALLSLQPRFAPALAMLASLALSQGREREAFEQFRAALAMDPRNSESRAAAARIALALGERDESRRLLEEGMRLRPGDAALWRQMGHLEMATGDADAAVRAFAQAVERAPTDAATHFNQGVALQQAGNLAQAGLAYERALLLDGKLVDARYNLGTVHQAAGNANEAQRCYAEVVAVQPTHSGAHRLLCELLLAAGRYDEWARGVWDFQRHCPDALPLAVAAIELARTIGDEATLQRYVAAVIDGRFRAASDIEHADCLEQLLFLLLYVDVEPGVTLTLSHRYDEVMQRLHGKPAPRPPRRPGRVRIGYLSADLRNHVMGKMMWPAISRHDRERFEVFAFSLASQRDEWTERFERGVEHFEVLASASDAAAAGRIAACDIDVLVDLSTNTRGARPGILACKPARVAITHVASAGALGLSAIDFKLTDAIADIRESAAFQIETPLLMEGCVYPYRHIEPSVADAYRRDALAIAPDAIVIGAFVNWLKLSPRCLALWRAILEAIPRAVLAFSPLQEHSRVVYERLAAVSAIPADRLMFLPPAATDEEGQARYRIVDFALDPMPYGGANGTLEPLDMGVPVVTLQGVRHGERAASSILTSLGVTQTIAHSPDEYVAIAARLANDAGFSSEVREAIRRGLADSPLVDANGYTRRLEDALLRALAAKGFATPSA